MLARAVIRWPRRMSAWCRKPGLPAGAWRAGQCGACFRPPLAGQGAELLAQWCGSGDQDRGQGGAGGLAGLHGVVPAGHQQPQCLPVAIRTHLGRMRPCQQLADRTDSVDRVALAGAALAHVAAAAGLRDLFTLAAQVAGQAQPIVARPLHRPHRLPGPGSTTCPGQQLHIPCRGGWYPQLRYHPAAGIAAAAVCVPRWVSTPMTRSASLARYHRASLRYPGCPTL